jgi:hypothetical protein
MTLEETIKKIEKNNKQITKIKGYATRELEKAISNNNKIVKKIHKLCEEANEFNKNKIMNKIESKKLKLSKKLEKHFSKIPDLEYLDSSLGTLNGGFGGQIEIEFFNGTNIGLKIQGKKMEHILNLEMSNYDLIIKAINETLDLLRPDQELNGTYWGAGFDYDLREVRGINYFLGKDYRFMSPEEFHRANLFKIKLVNHDVRKGFKFDKESQDLALIKTIYLGYEEAENDFWKNICHTLKLEGLVISDEQVTEEFKKYFKQVRTPLDDMSEPVWYSTNEITARTGHGFKKLKIYKKIK